MRLRMRSDFDVASIKEAVVELCHRNGIRWDSYIRPVAYYSGAEHHQAHGKNVESADTSAA